MCTRELCGSVLILWIGAGLAIAADMGPVSLASAEEPVAAQPYIEQAPITVSPQPALPLPSNAQSLLQSKLAERDRLQREITELRKSTNTPEQLLIRVRVLEIDRTKLNQAGVELKLMGSEGTPFDLTPILRGDRVVGYQTIDNSALKGVFEVLETQQFAKTIANPSIVTVSGDPASLHVGGEIPVPPVEVGGAITVKEYGTRLDVTATTLGDNRVRLAIHPRIAEVDDTQGIVVGGNKIPAVSLREVDSACELRLGESFLISGLVQQRRINKPGWAIRKSEEVHEIALVVVATPEIVR